jgi:hypothetical protein
MSKASRPRASKGEYMGENQLSIPLFETPFSQKLSSENRWVILAHRIPWDSLVGVYSKQLNNQKTGASGINPRVVLGSLILKHMCNVDDRELVAMIQENVYMQYFIGYSSFSPEAPFDPSLLVHFRKRMGIDQLNELNEKILGLSNIAVHQSIKHSSEPVQESESESEDNEDSDTPIEPSDETHKGDLLTDATACPQDIAYPTDINLLNDARVKTEELIDALYQKDLHKKKPRTYREVARKKYLAIAQKKQKKQKDIQRAKRQQLGYLSRNIKSINCLLDQLEQANLRASFTPRLYKYWLVVQTLHDQQKQMYQSNSRSVPHRIVSIHQPHIRPIVRGKAVNNTEFGAKIQVTMMNGYAFLDDFSWDAFNEGTTLKAVVYKYKSRFGYYPRRVLVDKIYCTRENRKMLKLLGIELRAKPLGRPKAVSVEHVSPGERNPIEGKFGQAKTAYGLNRIKARLASTSESWIATIILVLNLVKLAGEAPLCLFSTIYKQLITQIINWYQYNFDIKENLTPKLILIK